ncbi:MAG: DUF1080 domain-containing protein [Dysgonamonadaceae bacterium]|nr:DUF1080 domain-containing protein [Dysgonamonadaceae bacterium]
MLEKILCLLSLLMYVMISYAQQEQVQQTVQSRPSQWDPRSTEWHYPVPEKVVPGQGVKPPSDAIILFDGTDLSKWESANRNNPGAAAEWEVRNGELRVVPGKGTIRTKDYFGDCQLHIEFKSPAPGSHNGQDRGNSGIMLQSRYEIQVLDGDNNPTYVNGMVGSVYKQSAPLVNAYTKNGEWQIYDIYWRAPRFGTGGELESPAMVTVVLNGVVVQNNYILKGSTPYTGLPSYTPHGRMPLTLQDHGTEVAFRNIWIRNL